MALNPRVAADGLFIGQVAWLPGDGRGSAIAKTPVNGRRLLTVQGLAGDMLADRSAHGGGGKALHQYPAEHHLRLAAAFPSARNLKPGGLDEQWAGKLGQRVEWLRNNARGGAA